MKKKNMEQLRYEICEMLRRSRSRNLHEFIHAFVMAFICNPESIEALKEYKR